MKVEEESLGLLKWASGEWDTFMRFQMAHQLPFPCSNPPVARFKKEVKMDLQTTTW